MELFLTYRDPQFGYSIDYTSDQIGMDCTSAVNQILNIFTFLTEASPLLSRLTYANTDFMPSSSRELYLADPLDYSRYLPVAKKIM